MPSLPVFYDVIGAAVCVVAFVGFVAVVVFTFAPHVTRKRR